MKELTLTGGTLLDLSAGVNNSDVEMASMQPQQQQRQQQQQANAQASAALELVKQGDPTTILQALFGIVRMGPFLVFMEILKAWKDHVSASEVEKQIKEGKDAHGHSLLHWAAKRVDSPQFAGYLLRFIPVSVTSTSDDTGMSPLHWACTEAHALPIVRLFVNHDRYAVELTDATGCTPLLIAAQHGHVETVAYLLQLGANLHAVDSSRDSATHWAAYKGSRHVLGLLSFYDTRQLTTADTYGQTPLHLAALRGHKSVCKYILSHVEKKQALQLLSQRDRNGRTPQALAVHKDKHSVASFLSDYHEELTCPNSQKYKRLLQRNILNFFSPASWKLWLGVTVDSSDVDESPLFPFYYVCLHFVLNAVYYIWVFWAVGDTSEGVLWDCILLLVWQAIVYSVGVYALVQTSSMNPGRVDSSFPYLNEWRQLYETTLELYASSSTLPSGSVPQLCHACHIARPPRSKHDRFTDSCILVFDHHCPFVGNSIGLYNYKWFYLFVTCTTVYLAQHCIILMIWWRRQSHSSPLTLLFGAFLGVHGIFAAGMCLYHTKLVAENMTTNESMNPHKYTYLWESTVEGCDSHVDEDASPQSGRLVHPHRHRHATHKRFRNQFDKGWWVNAIERLVHPSETSYMVDDQMSSLLSDNRRGSTASDPNAV